MELVGRRFGQFRVTDALGQGGMGDVYAAWDEKLERKVALKVLNADQRLDEESRARLLREARALSKLDHPNICRIYDYIERAGEHGEVDLLVLEYIEGETLHVALEKNRMLRADKLRIAIQVAQVLIDAHRAGIVHRDLKPENVMLTKSGEVKVLDFGLARWFNKSPDRSDLQPQQPRQTGREALIGSNETPHGRGPCATRRRTSRVAVTSSSRCVRRLPRSASFARCSRQIRTRASSNGVSRSRSCCAPRRRLLPVLSPLRALHSMPPKPHSDPS